MPNVAVDTSVLVALFDRSEREHSRAVRFIRLDSHHLVTNAAVLTETAALLDFSAELPAQFIEWAHQAMEVDEGMSADLPRIAEIMRKYADLPADFADASLLALCERRGILAIATLDSDFDIYRTASRKSLLNAFLDI